MSLKSIQTVYNVSSVYSIKSIYVSQSPLSDMKNRVYLGIDSSGNNSLIYWFDISGQPTEGIPTEGIDTTIYPDTSLFLSGYSGIKSMDGYGNILYIVIGKNIIKVNYTLPSWNVIHQNTIGNYNSIYVLDQNNIAAAGENIISFSTDGGTTWTDISANIPIINKICLCDASNAIAVCNSGKILTTSNWKYGTSWSTISNDALNVSGNSNRLNDPNYNLTNVGMVDTNNFYITKTITKDVRDINGITTYGNTSLFHVYLPNLFNNIDNHVFDVSGSSRISGDLNVNDGGKIASNNQTFKLLNNGVNQIYFGGDASNVYIGSLQKSTVTVNSNLHVLFDSLMNGNLGVKQNAVINGTLGVTGDTNIKSNLNVTGNTNINANLNVTGNTNINSTLNVTGNTNINSNLNVTGNTNINSVLNVTGNTNINSVLNVTGDTNINSNLNVTGNTNIHSVLNAVSYTHLTLPTKRIV